MAGSQGKIAALQGSSEAIMGNRILLKAEGVSPARSGPDVVVVQGRPRMHWWL